MLELREALRSSRIDAERASARPPGLRERLDRLRDKGVAISETLEDEILSDPRRRGALMQQDFSKRGTALEHIERVADAGRLADNTQSGRLASQMLKLAGAVREQRGWGMSYARANQAVFTAHHAGELCRLIADLAVDRRTELASGQKVRWSPAEFPIDPGRHMEFLWGGLNHLLVQDELPEDASLSEAAPVASQAQMANLMTRLTGHPYVNAQARGSVALRQIIDAYGPPLAKYGNHAGSLAKFDVERRPLSLETGDSRPQHMTHPLDFVVIPHE
ncbi:MAG TPA: hypothetical protein VH208_06340, partial [Myxococcaceae bacterium]|nr:hypothetical protein [Myxococcaceae bacterium]